MSIVNMTTDHNRESYPDGAYCPIREWRKEQLVLWESYKGLCLSEREVNGYNDSDFYMTVWNPEKEEPESIMFATTRGWSYPCLGSSVDATPEVQEKYDAYRKHMARKQRILWRWSLRHQLMRIAEKSGHTYWQIRDLYHNVHCRDDFEAIVWLLTANVRSDFKKSLKKQVEDWLVAEKRKYNTPLSGKQMQYIRGNISSEYDLRLRVFPLSGKQMQYIRGNISSEYDLRLRVGWR